MTLDALTLPLFDEPPQPIPLAMSLPPMPPGHAENFAWWCQHGNRAMCEAVLRREFSVPAADAAKIVMTYASPACAHFARPMGSLEHRA